VKTTILWFRRDLRLRDHPALHAARERADRLVPVFVLDDRLIHGRHASGARTQFLLDCLNDLDAALEKRDTRLVVRHGPPERELAALARETGATELHFSADVTPFARARGRRVAEALADMEVELHAHPGQYVADVPGDVRTKAGTPQTVFGHYYRAWLDDGRREVLPAPRALPPLPSGLAKGRTLRSAVSASSRRWMIPRPVASMLPAPGCARSSTGRCGSTPTTTTRSAATTRPASRPICALAASRRASSRTRCR
jgi:deoxyribodipyrimidine photo-lyase